MLSLLNLSIYIHTDRTRKALKKVRFGSDREKTGEFPFDIGNWREGRPKD